MTVEIITTVIVTLLGSKGASMLYKFILDNRKLNLKKDEKKEMTEMELLRGRVEELESKLQQNETKLQQTEARLDRTNALLINAVITGSANARTKKEKNQWEQILIKLNELNLKPIS